MLQRMQYLQACESGIVFEEIAFNRSDSVGVQISETRIERGLRAQRKENVSAAMPSFSSYIS